ncbi:MAG: UDP-N-acetylglucosamine--N-acetylmuramyl-(pentapeptide) pyrophosphoryl-undecaprenol N-acetylglucosamine transferase [Clostridia bacterium]|nr:UDP-N-acetylglucosamine--N-acetylmuramyl-(pentapeptide) pyrophosphoryl-undecaprenol N-acetylglucosamine transferase [Clostridia bacterium]
MKMIVSCGGTGGHITPALALADTVKCNEPRAEILFVGSERGMENTLVKDAGYAIEALRVEGISRRISLTNLRALYRAGKAVGQAKRLIQEFSPDIVIGTGGYACYPTLRAAALLGVPCAVHESNAVPGLAVRRLAAKVDRVWLNFEAAKDGLPQSASTLVVGNPLPIDSRRGGGALRLPSGCRRMVLSFGGSLGARELNRAVLDLMERERGLADVYHCHATGKREYDAFLAEFSARGLTKCPNLEVLPYINDMPRRMAAADVVISRAGAMSISEIAAASRAAVLIPSPNVTGDHQYKNAKMLADAGAAYLVTEDRLADGELTKAVLSLLASEEKRRALASAVGAFARPDANRLILQDIRKLAKK